MHCIVPISLYCSDNSCVWLLRLFLVWTPIKCKPKAAARLTWFFNCIIPYLNYVALVCTGVCMWVLEASRVSWQETERGRCADLILLSSGAAAFRFVPATVLLHLPFVYFKVRKRGERMVGETHIFSSLRVLLYSP